MQLQCASNRGESHYQRAVPTGEPRRAIVTTRELLLLQSLREFAKEFTPGANREYHPWLCDQARTVAAAALSLDYWRLHPRVQQVPLLNE